ncbi:MAG: tetratricopeptide repeat protein [Spirochaetia bacterium]
MDTPTPSATLAELAPGETVEVPLYALFNKEIFLLEGVTPLTGEVIISYSSRGRPAEQRKSITYNLHDKTALTWDDARKIAALITPSDGALRNYASYIRQAAKDAVIPGYSDALQFAVQAFYALDEIGILYQADPASPFTEAQGNTLLVDSVSLPRDTLTRITGDCDDLTVLYNSLLETTGVETGFITTPGHIYSVVNTQVDAADYAMVHPDRRMTLVIDEKIWVPVEITLIGLASFTEAWKSGVDEWHKYENSMEQRGFYSTRASQQIFLPVSLTERDLGLQYGNPDVIRTRFIQELDAITGAIAGGYRAAMSDPPTKVGYNKLGILHAGFGQYEAAESAFQAALVVDPGFISAKINLGSLNFLLGNYDLARNQFTESYDRLQELGRANSRLASQVLINLSNVSERLNETEQAADAYRMAAVADPDAVREYEGIGAAEETGTRASAVPDLNSQILFVND